MSRIFQQQLKQRRDAVLQEAEIKLKAQDEKDIESLLEKISIYNSILSSVPDQKRKKTDMVVATLIWLICVSLVGLAWGKRLEHTKVVLQVETQSLAVELAEPLDWSEGIAVVPDKVSIERMDVLQLTGATSSFDFKGRVSGEMSGGNIRLAALKQSPEGELLIRSVDGELIEIASKNAVFNGRLTLSGDTIISAKRSADRIASNYAVASSKGPESIIFQSQQGGAVPAVLRFSPKKELVLQNLKIRALNFSQKKPMASMESDFVSGISGGSILLSEIAETIDLRKTDQLSLSGVAGNLTEIRVKDSILLRFEGEVEQILKGSKDFSQDLRPSYLQYIYHQQPLTMFFSAVTFLWGISWSAKKLLLA